MRLMDDVTSWLPGNRIVIASTDYSMHQAEEFTLLPCPECGSHQVKISGMDSDTHNMNPTFFRVLYLSFCSSYSSL